MTDQGRLLLLDFTATYTMTGSGTGATFVTGYTIGSGLLGSTIVDGASHAGLDTFDLRANDTSKGTFTFTFYELTGGASTSAWNGLSNGESVLGTADVTFSSAGSGGTIIPCTTFDSALDFTATSTGIAIHVDSSVSIPTRADQNVDGVDGSAFNRATGAKLGGAAGARPPVDHCGQGQSDTGANLCFVGRPWSVGASLPSLLGGVFEVLFLKRAAPIRLALPSLMYRLLFLSLLSSVFSLRGADIAIGNATADLGADFFFDNAAIGGSDNTTADFNRTLSGFWTTGATVTLRGLAWASSASGTTATEATLTLTDLGADELLGTADDVIVATISDNLVFTGAGEYVWDFDSDVVFVAGGASLQLGITSNGPIRRKTAPSGNTTQAAVKLSLAGTAVSGEAPPANNTATANGFWDVVTWDTGSGTAIGDLGAKDSVFVGEYLTVTYRGVPANEEVGTLYLGRNSTAEGQGTLVVESGDLTIGDNLNVGRNTSANDSFLEVRGGSLSVQGDAFFGTSAASCDGSLIVAGGEFAVAGNLTMGAFERGGSMMRFHNPGSSPVASVAGELTLNRAALDLTFDENYVHTVGSQITLLSYGSRDGQFVNARRGQEVNWGPNRFRVNYDVPGNGQLALTLTALENWQTDETPPNIIFIFTDDQGYADLELNEHPTWAAKYPMPELQKIATNGARFTDAYVSAGVCHPSRCGILSGIHQQRIGSDNNLSGPSYNGLSTAVSTVPRRLQGLGYKTYGVGKWHLGDTVEYHPNVRGFDRWYGMWSGSRSYYNAPAESRVFQDQMTPVFADENTGYLTDRIGDSTVDFIDEHLANDADKPFYIYMSFTAVHGPMDIRAADARFDRLETEFGLTAADYLNSPRVFANSSQAAVDANRYELAAMTLALDENIGKVLAKVEDEGLTDNTIFLYLTDNGGAEWVPSFAGNYSYNFPLKGKKGATMEEGSIRVPCAMQWPGKFSGNQEISTPVSSLDFMATFVNAGGAPAQARNGLDGLDLIPLLSEGEPLPAERVIPFRASGVTGGGSALRKGKWKLFNSDGGFNPVLYDLETDIGETTNVAAANPEIFEELKERFLAWDMRTIVPLYGGGGVQLDAGLERTAIPGGYRLRTAASAPVFLSGPLREEQAMTEDWEYSFFLRATEANQVAAAKLVYGLGDSALRGDLIQAVVDFGTSQITLLEGKTGAMQSQSIAALPQEFELSSFMFESASNTLTFALGADSVSLTLTGNYQGGLSHFAVGAAAMEGELTSLRQGAADYSGSSLEFDVLSTDLSGLTLEVGPEGPFNPVVERATNLGEFVRDESALVESFGGGLYRLSFEPEAGEEREFFRMRFNQPNL